MIEFRRVTKQFPDGTVAVEDVDIVMPPHKTTVLSARPAPARPRCSA